jgi:radical SAM-linked protein
MKGITARVKYSKNGLLRFIGHLDTTRTLLRAIRRAGIEGVYSEGFTPRLRVSFGPPLPLGFTSDCEYLDMRLGRRYEPESIREKLQAQLPQGLDVKEVQVLEGGAPSLQEAFWAAEYEVELVRDHPVGLEGVTRCDSLEASCGDPSSASGEAGKDRVLCVSRHNREDGRETLTLLLRQDVSGGGRVKEIIGSFLSVEGKRLEKLRIHKKRVYRQGERI